MSDVHFPIKVFCSYAPEDESFFQQLQKHLSVLTRQKRVVLWHHRQDYQTVFWVLADTRESLVSGYVAIAGLLHLPERNAGSRCTCAICRQRVCHATPLAGTVCNHPEISFIL